MSFDLKKFIGTRLAFIWFIIRATDHSYLSKSIGSNQRNSKRAKNCSQRFKVRKRVHINIAGLKITFWIIKEEAKSHRKSFPPKYKHCRNLVWPFTSFISFRCRDKMLSRAAIKNIIRQELLGFGKQWNHKTLVRSILTSGTSSNNHHTTSNAKDIIVNSPLPSLNYPDCSIDQYVWNDCNKWSNQTALVSKILARQNVHWLRNSF